MLRWNASLVWIALLAVCLPFGGLLLPAAASAQVLPPHEPMRILIVSDEVNPHGLPEADLTQPGDLSAALLGVSALRLEGAQAVLEIPTDQIEQATALLELPAGDPGAYDVLIYFAHRIPTGADAVTRQEAFVAAVDGFLQSGGGVISFHHGIYFTAGKETMQSLLGAQATGAVPWNTVDGQNVIAVAPNHFVASYGVDYPASISYEDATHGVAPGSYPAFNNTPDERYPSFSLVAGPGELEILFGSDYDAASHLLGYTQTRDDWTGAVMVYQPGEYEPNALSGNNFQILLNAVVWTARHAEGDLIFADGFESGSTALW